MEFQTGTQKNWRKAVDGGDILFERPRVHLRAEQLQNRCNFLRMKKSALRSDISSFMVSLILLDSENS